MATLIDLAREGKLEKLDPQLDPGVQEDRCIYMTPRFSIWLGSDLYGLRSHWETQFTPAEQLDELIATFCAGEELTHGTQFHVLNHVNHGVWELKTPDIRVIGWFHRKDCFVAASGHDATYVKEHDLYHGLINETVGTRDSLNLDEPKFVPGGEPRDVVSNFSYP